MRDLRNERGSFGPFVFFLCGLLLLQLSGIANAGEVKITAPLYDSVVEGTVAITLSMHSSVSWANVYVDGVYLASTPDPISWNTTASPNGTHIISAKAFDSSGTMVGSTSKTVRVKNKPTPTATATPSSGQLTITSPANGASVSGTVSVVVQYASPVDWLNFYVDGTWVASSPPYTLSWNSTDVANGQHSISVSGYNTSNALVATAAINVNVQNGSGATPTPSSAPTSTPQPTATPSSSATPYYALLPNGSTLPSDSQCAAGVAGDTFEPRPGNAPFNAASPSSSDLSTYQSNVSGGEGGAPGSYLQRADGQFTGTTDAILKWASCKWGFDENVTRATAVNESYWNQDDIGDVGNGISLGILQIKSADYPATCEAVASSQSTSDVTNPDCYSYLMTAFAADYKLAQQRACFEGQVSYLTSDTPSSGYPTYPNGTSDQMMWGCVGWWYSGHWYDSGALNYISQVQGYLSAETWLQPGF
jgi:hypothetical protein